MKREVESGIEQTDMDDVSRLIGRLKHVSAPRNFDRAVMTRIADGAPERRRIFGLSPALAYALPLVLIAVVGTAIFFATRRTAAPRPEVADAGPHQFSANQTPAVPVVIPSAEPSIVAANPQPEHKIAFPVGPAPPANSTKRKQATQPGGGSQDEALSAEQPITSVPNAPNAPPSSNRDEVVSNNTLPARDMLTLLGIRAEYSGGWVVRRVTSNSQADRSGIRVGDIVIALGDTTLNANTEFKGQFSASRARVRRGGQEIELALK